MALILIESEGDKKYESETAWHSSSLITFMWSWVDDEFSVTGWWLKLVDKTMNKGGIREVERILLVEEGGSYRAYGFDRLESIEKLKRVSIDTDSIDKTVNRSTKPWIDRQTRESMDKLLNRLTTPYIDRQTREFIESVSIESIFFISSRFYQISVYRSMSIEFTVF